MDVEHRAIDRPLSPEEEKAAFGEKTVELTATSETPEIAKEARAVEEVVLSKTASEQEKTVEAVARRTDVKVEPVGADPSHHGLYRGRHDRHEERVTP